MPERQLMELSEVAVVAASGAGSAMNGYVQIGKPAGIECRDQLLKLRLQGGAEFFVHGYVFAADFEVDRDGFEVHGAFNVNRLRVAGAAQVDVNVIDRPGRIEQLVDLAADLLEAIGEPVIGSGYRFGLNDRMLAPLAGAAREIGCDREVALRAEFLLQAAQFCRQGGKDLGAGRQMMDFEMTVDVGSGSR